MSSIVWFVGRALQILALAQVAFALYAGMNSGDSRQELRLMLFGVVEFLMGQWLLSKTGARE